MTHAHRLRPLALVALAASTVGCSLSIDQILEIDEGSALNMALAGTANNPRPDGVPNILELSGGAVMRLDVSLSLLDYLDGVADGDIEVLDLLLAVPEVLLFQVIPTGDLCIVLDGEVENGGTFTYDLLAQEAAFDLVMNTLALSQSPTFSNLVPGGAMEFPFAFDATTEMSAVDLLGLLTGTGTLQVQEDVDQYVILPILFGSSVLEWRFHVTGTVGMTSTDAFPTPPGVLSCLEFLASS